MTHDDIPQPVRDLMRTMTSEEVVKLLRRPLVISSSARFAAALLLAAEAVEREAKRKDGQR